MPTEITAHQHEEVVHSPSLIERSMQFLRDVRQEMTKVVTPNRYEVQNTTIVVIIVVFLFAAFFELVDLTLGRGIDKILLHLTSRH
jgi:preprotein translocase subunit SecE